MEIPKRRLTAFAGVSGSGKSSLVVDTIAAESQHVINETYSSFVQGFMPSMARAPSGWLQVRGASENNLAGIDVDIPTGALDAIRKAFAKATGESASMFSPNSDGACQHCKGAGVVYVDLGLIQGVDVPCEVCEGRRFQDGVLIHTFGGKNIVEVLAMPAEQAQPYLKEN